MTPGNAGGEGAVKKFAVDFFEKWLEVVNLSAGVDAFVCTGFEGRSAGRQGFAGSAAG